MKVSAKGRYGLASLIYMAQIHSKGEAVTVIKISERLGISKIYLEQTFSLLKRGGIVIATKGSQGGYRLSKEPDKITAYDVLYSIESSLFSETETTVPETAPTIEAVMQNLVFNPLAESAVETLRKISLTDLVDAEAHLNTKENYMFFI